MPTLNYTYTTPSNYTFDTDLIEIDGGKAKLKNLTPVNETFYANYNSNIDGNRGNGILTGTSFGGAVVSGGKLDLTYNDIRYVDYNATLNADSIQTGCIRFKLTPNYNIGPASEGQFFTIAKENNNTDNVIYMRHSTGGHLRLHMYSSTGSLIQEIYLSTFNAVLGQEYIFEINYDLNIGETRVFINGVQKGTTATGTGIRDSNIGLLRIGSDWDHSTSSNFKIDDFQIFSTVQHTTNYTPIPCIETVYCIQNPTILTNSGFLTDNITSLTETTIISGSDNIKHILRYNNIDYYWNGSTWVISDGTYSQSNTIIEINTNISSLTFPTIGATVYLKSFIHSNDGLTTPELDNEEFIYDYRGPTPDNPLLCNVSGFLRDVNNQPIANNTIKITLNDFDTIDSKNILISREIIEVVTDSLGHWAIDLIYSTEYTNNYTYNFNIGNKQYENITVPTQELASFSDMINS